MEDISPVQVVSPVHVSMSRHLMSSRLFFFLRWLLMRCLLMRNLLTFSTKKSQVSRYLKSSLLTSLYRFIHQDARRLLMSDLFVEKVSRFLMSRHLMSSHLKKKMRWLLMRCLLTTTWTGLMSFCHEFFFLVLTYWKVPVAQVRSSPFRGAFELHIIQELNLEVFLERAKWGMDHGWTDEEIEIVF